MPCKPGAGLRISEICDTLYAAHVMIEERDDSPI